MVNEIRLNVDIPSSITEFEEVVKEFKLKRDIYRIIFRGKGLEFEGFRDFSPDDDAKDIDWKTSSRAQKLIVKQYKEERDLKIFFIIDVGTNMVFGSTEKLKCEYVVEVASAFMDLIMKSNDRIGLILFSDNVKHFIESKNGKKHFQLLTDVLSNGLNYGGKSDLNQALDFAMNYLDTSVFSVILISDFLNVNYETEKKLNILSSQFETIAIRVRDPLDVTLPDVEGEVVLEDPSTHSQILINPKVAKRFYESYSLDQGRSVEKMFKKSGLDYVDLFTNKPFSIPLAVFLRERLMNKI